MTQLSSHYIMSLTKHRENKTPPAGAANTHRRLTRQLKLAVDAADVHSTIVVVVAQRYQAVALACVARDGRFCFCDCLARAGRVGALPTSQVRGAGANTTRLLTFDRLVDDTIR